MPFVNPYRALVAQRDPVDILVETARDVPTCVCAWPSAQFDETYAPGKRSAHRILLHLLHVEIVDGVRLRMALSAPGYLVQPFDPDAWMNAEPLNNGPAALVAWRSLRAVNLQLWNAATPGNWDRRFRHPECGTMTVRDLAEIWAGHDLHHLEQLRAIDREYMMRACTHTLRES